VPGLPRQRRPISPGPSRWQMPHVAGLTGELVAVGADLAPATLLDAYRAGMFAMPEGSLLGWWSPDPRGVLLPGEVHVSRSLRRSLRHFEVSLDRSFDRVLALCADPARPGGWISPDYARTYRELHRLGWAHSIEVWRGDLLAGGLFGVELGGLFAAESKAHVLTDASKVAVVALADLLADGQPRLIDVQWRTEHLATLGVRQIPRADYLTALGVALRVSPRLCGQTPGSAAASRITWRSG
jgi:leucyl/phenylalanyl-tRNA---protein transferase